MDVFEGEGCFCRPTDKVSIRVDQIAVQQALCLHGDCLIPFAGATRTPNLGRAAGSFEHVMISKDLDREKPNS